MAIRKSESVAKITRPIPTSVSSRERLFSRLDDGRAGRVLWVSGPAGSGKTTLVSSYIESRNLPCLWYQADKNDSDIATFFHFMSIAAKKARSARSALLPKFEPEYAQGLPKFSQRYFECLYRGLRSPGTVVIDNYQEVPLEAPFHKVVRDGFSMMRDGISAILISRAAPPRVLARLGVNDELSRIGWDEMRLTPEETREIARLKGQGRESGGSLGKLHDLAGGWVAGLILMLETSSERDVSLRSIARHPPEELFDYFAGEIFEKLDGETREFLLRTALLPRMTVRTVEQLTGNPRAGRILAYLNRHNYFTERRFHVEPVYQYHPLFREFLLSRVAECGPARERQKERRRAAALLEETGQVGDAAEVLSEAGDPEGLARLVLKEAPALVAQGRCHTLDERIKSLPPDLVSDAPWLLYWKGVCRLPFDLDESRACFDRAFGLFRERGESDGVLLAWSGVVDTFIYGWGDFRPLDRWLAALDEIQPRNARHPSVEIEARVAFSMFNAMLFRQPQHPRFAEWAERSFEAARRLGDVNRQVTIFSHLVHYYVWAGDLARMTLVAEALQDIARSSVTSPLALLERGAAEAIYFWFTASHAACLDAIRKADGISRESGIRLLDFFLLSMKIYGTLSAGDLDSARKLVREMPNAVRKARELDRSHYHYTAAWGAMARGDIPLAVTHAEASLGLARELGTPFPETFCHIGLAQLFLKTDEADRAASHLEEARALNRGIRSKLLEFMILLLDARHMQAAGEEARGLASLRSAMALGKRQGFVNVSFWDPALMTALCIRALDAGIEVEYVQDLVRRRGLVPDRAPVETPNWPWPVKIYTLGRFALIRDGKPARLSGRVQKKPLSLLKALIAMGGREVAEDRITDALWPDIDGDLAHKAFAVTVHRLRKLLGGETALKIREGRLLLDNRFCWVDVWALERALGQAEEGWKKETAGSDPSNSVRLSEKAIGLYKGPFLLGETGEPWVAPIRERVRSKFVRCVTQLGNHWETAGQWDKAGDCYRKGLETDNLAEELCRRLMACCLRQGRTAEAFAAYDRLRQTLASVLKVEPSAETKALLNQLHVV